MTDVRRYYGPVEFPDSDRMRNWVQSPPKPIAETADIYGPEVTKLARAWRKRPDAADMERSYYADREQAYQRIAAAYVAAGQTAPDRDVLSGGR